MKNIKARYELNLAARCMKPCMKNFTTPVVAERESKCMTNCVAKGLETMSHFLLDFSRL